MKMDSWSRLTKQPDEDKKLSAFQRKGSKRKTPPNMLVTKQERRILLLEFHTDAKVSCGNIIMGRKMFSESPSTPRLFERHAGLVLKRRLMVINTPDLLDLAHSSKEQDVRECFNLTYPGPHVLLLVLKPGTFTDQERDALRLINNIFGTAASEFVIVVFSHEAPTSSCIEFSDTDHRAMDSLLQTCRQPTHHLRWKGDHSQVQKLLESIDKMVVDNGGSYLRLPEKSEVTDEPDVDCLTSKDVGGCEESSSDMRIVLIGKTGVGKSAAGNIILGQEVFRSKASMLSATKQCQRESREIHGRRVTVVDTPGLFDTTLTDEEIQQEIMRCIELCAPGPHVFLLLISVGRFTEEEKGAVNLIQLTFGEKAQNYTIVLFTRGDSLGEDKIEEYIETGHADIQKVIHDCGGRYHVFNNKDKNPDQVQILLNKIDMMVKNNDNTFFNNTMFLEAERARKIIQQYKKERRR